MTPADRERAEEEAVIREWLAGQLNPETGGPLPPSRRLSQPLPRRQVVAVVATLLAALDEARAALEREDADLPEWDTPAVPVHPDPIEHVAHRGNHVGYACGFSGPHCWACNEPWPCRAERARRRSLGPGGAMSGPEHHRRSVSQPMFKSAPDRPAGLLRLVDEVIFDLPIGEDVTYSRGYSAGIAAAREGLRDALRAALLAGAPSDPGEGT